VSIGKIILVVLATMVFFTPGRVRGVVVVKRAAPPPAKPPAFPEGPGWPQFLHRIQNELDLTPEQRQRIGTILRESQERTRGFAGGEFRKVREQIHGELMTPQKEKFDRLIRERQRRAQEMRSLENRPGFRSNGPMSIEGPRRPSANRPEEALPPAESPH